MNISISSKKNLDPNASLSFVERFAYGTGDFAGNIVYSAITIFLVFYYTDVIGMSAGIIGTIMLVSRVLDGVLDLLMGFVVDRTKSRHGKARVWILRMAIPYALSAIVLFSVPIHASNTFKVIYIFISYNLSQVVFTALNIPYATMNALMTQNQYERGVLGIFRMLLATAGTMFINTFTLKVVKIFGGDAKAWTTTFAIFGFVSILILLFTFYGTKERVLDETTKENQISAKVGVISLFKNKYWCIIAGSIFCLYFMLTVSGASGVYYAKSILGNQNLVVQIGNAQTIAQVATMFFTAFFIKKWGKRNIFFVGILIMVIGCFVMTIAPVFNVIIAGNILKGIGGGFGASAMFGMLSDTIEYGEWKTGIRVAGLANAASSFGSKVGSGVGGAVLGWVLSIGKYDGLANVQPNSAIVAINIVYIYIPIVISIIVLIMLNFYKLDKEYPKIVEDLKKRKMEN